MPSKTFPKSVVRVTRTSGPLPPILMRPTDDSGFAFVLAENIRFTASACASHLDGLRIRKHIESSSFYETIHVVSIPTTLTVVHPEHRVKSALVNVRQLSSLHYHSRLEYHLGYLADLGR